MNKHIGFVLGFFLLIAANTSLAQTSNTAQIDPGINTNPPLIVQVGTLDKAGFGGIDLSTAVSGFPSIVSEINNDTSAASTDLIIDSWGQLVPAPSSGTFPTAYGTTAKFHSLPPATGYTLVISGANSGTATVKVSMCQLCSFTRSHYAGPAYTPPAPYSQTNPDYTGNVGTTGPTAQFQLQWVFADATLPLDAKVYMRDGAGVTGLTPGLHPWTWFQQSGNSGPVYTAVVPSLNSNNDIAKYTFSDGSGAALVNGTSVSGNTLSFTGIVDSTGTGLSNSKTYNIVAPGFDQFTTASNCTPGNTFSSGSPGTCTLNKPALSDFQAGENVNITSYITLQPEHATQIDDGKGNPMWVAGTQIGQLSIRSAALDFFIPVHFLHPYYYNDIPPKTYLAKLCGYIDNGSGSAGNLLTVIASTGTACVTSGNVDLSYGYSPVSGSSLVSVIKPETYIIGTTSGCNTSVSGYVGCYQIGSGTPNITTPNSQLVSSSSSPQQFYTQMFGSWGGQPGVANKLSMFQSLADYGIKVDYGLFEVGPDVDEIQINNNYLAPAEFGQAFFSNNYMRRGGVAEIQSGYGNYNQRPVTGSPTAKSCYGTAGSVSCLKSYIWANIFANPEADGIDPIGNTGDGDVEYNFEFGNNSNVNNFKIPPGDGITICDEGSSGITTCDPLTASVGYKTYTWVSTVVGPCNTIAMTGNCEGYVPLNNTNPVMNLVNLTCTINAAHNSYVQFALYNPNLNSTYPNGNSIFLCVDGVNLPAIEHADNQVIAAFSNLKYAEGTDTALFPKTPGDVITETWFSSKYNITNGANNGYWSAYGTGIIGTFTATYGLNSSTGLNDLNVTAVTDTTSGGQVVVGAPIICGTGCTAPANTIITGYVSGVALGQPGHYTLNNAITCSSCSISITLGMGTSGTQGTGSSNTWPAVIQGSLHPDFSQVAGLSVAIPGYVPMNYKYNISVRGNADPNRTGAQGFFGNGLANACCYSENIQNNLVLSTFTDLAYLEQHYGSTINQNTMLADVGADFADTNDPSWNNISQFQWGALGAHGVAEFLCGTGTPGNNSLTDNILNQVVQSGGGAYCGTPPPVFTPTVPETIQFIGSGPSQETQAAVTARYQGIMPDYQNYNPSGPGGSGACPQTREGLIACTAPLLGTLFTASLTTSCVLTSTTSLPDNIHINGPGFAVPGNYGAQDPDVVPGTTTYNAGIYTYTLDQLSSGCTAETNATYGTGAENPDGTYNGWLFPIDNAGGTFTGHIFGNKLYVTSTPTGTLAAQQTVSSPGNMIPVQILTQISGTVGGIGIYTININENVGSVTMKAGVVSFNDGAVFNPNATHSPAF